MNYTYNLNSKESLTRKGVKFEYLPTPAQDRIKTISFAVKNVRYSVPVQESNTVRSQKVATKVIDNLTTQFVGKKSERAIDAQEIRRRAAAEEAKHQIDNSGHSVAAEQISTGQVNEGPVLQSGSQPEDMKEKAAGARMTISRINSGDPNVK